MSANNHKLEDRDKSLVWGRDSGNRVIVIIDDDFRQVLNAKPVTAHAQGLRPIFEYMSRLPDTRAVGYFYLPGDEDDMREELYPNIQAWLGEVGGTQQLYFLIDVFFGYDVSDERSAFGVTVLNYLKPLFPEAQFAYLNTAGAPEELMDPDFPITSIPKNQVAQEFRRVPSTLPKLLLEYLDIDPRPTASTIDAQRWRRLRRKAAGVCRLIDEEAKLHSEADAGGWMWAHHLPHGGKWWGTAISDEQQNLWTARLRGAYRSVAPAARAFPDYAWEMDVNNGIHGWERPPIRALAQFDTDGGDLSAALYLLKNEVGELFKNSVTILFASTLSENPNSLSKDYLWFNVSALAKGLFMLAQTFRDEVDEAIKDGGSKGLSLPCIGGHLFWHITEVDGGEDRGLRIRVHQHLLGWNKDKNKGAPCFHRLSHPFPSEVGARGQVREAYKYFRLSGARIDVQGKILVLTLRAAEIRDEVNPNVVYWEVATGDA